MTFVMVTVDSGIIDEVTFFEDKNKSIHALKEYVKSMNEERNDAAVYDRNGFVANAKMYMKKEDMK
jgi:hypothetical protein